jgi:Tol biopolymer transport system component
VWFDRNGKAGARLGAPANITHVELSSDGRYVASRDLLYTPPRISIYDVARDIRTLLNMTPASEFAPVWSPRGDEVFFGSFREANATVLGTPWNRAGVARELLGPATGVTWAPRALATDGHLLLERDVGGKGDLWVMTAGTEQSARPYVATAADEREAAVTTDGRVSAYVSDVRGAFNVFVEAFPQAGGFPMQISTRGGRYPRWRRDGKELYYVNSTRQMIAVSVTRNEIGNERVLFDAPIEFAANRFDIPYDVSADGEHFLMAVPRANAAIEQAIAEPNPITVILNWSATRSR